MFGEDGGLFGFGLVWSVIFVSQAICLGCSCQSFKDVIAV